MNTERGPRLPALLCEAALRCEARAGRRSGCLSLSAMVRVRSQQPADHAPAVSGAAEYSTKRGAVLLRLRGRGLASRSRCDGIPRQNPRRAIGRGVIPTFRFTWPRKRGHGTQLRGGTVPMCIGTPRDTCMAGTAMRHMGETPMPLLPRHPSRGGIWRESLRRAIGRGRLRRLGESAVDSPTSAPARRPVRRLWPAGRTPQAPCCTCCRPLARPV